MTRDLDFASPQGDTAFSEGTAHRALIGATIESIHRHGLGATTVDTICRLADLSRGMIRHCFSSKDALLVAAYEHLCGEWARGREARQASFGTPGRRQLYSLAESMFTPPSFDPVEMSAWLAYSVAALSIPDLREVNRRAYDLMRRDAETNFAAAAAEAGVAVDPWQAACAFIALTDGLWLQHLLEPEVMTREVAMRACFDFIDNALDRKERADDRG